MILSVCMELWKKNIPLIFFHKRIFLIKDCLSKVRHWIFPQPLKAAARRRGRAAAAALRSSDAESRLECRGRSFSKLQPERCGRNASMATPGPNGSSAISGGVVGSTSHHFHQQTQGSSMQGNPPPTLNTGLRLRERWLVGSRGEKKTTQTHGEKTQTRQLKPTIGAFPVGSFQNNRLVFT